MLASLMGHVDIVKTLIEAKAQINTQDKVWLLLPPENTLHNMSSYTVLLYIAEPTVHFYPQDGCTALHLAVLEDKVDVVRLLTEAKAHVNIQIKVRTL